MKIKDVDFTNNKYLSNQLIIRKEQVQHLTEIYPYDKVDESSYFLNLAADITFAVINILDCLKINTDKVNLVLVDRVYRSNIIYQLLEVEHSDEQVLESLKLLQEYSKSNSKLYEYTSFIRRGI